ncbi:O-succinylbenzoic acid--CoA ligase [Ulvibacter sp. MAR_2010_11]|uniref:AMP-binding protein n=1 Tax=Ulvibacter sp. MAR_2010_11 TaxID=1250229 RepID=UPI000CB421C0|nr:AMP-binding protein [Ulvibacter sp. MAR_2010_11]PKA84550.1 O-succinylbenzoic acid--CoA ligase [Ulvibacter sp. MAR_2010_11]
MNTTSPILHPAFTLNGLQFETVDELLQFAKGLEIEGDDYEVSIGKFIQKWFNQEDSIQVKTSGATGKSKKIRLRKDWMIHSAQATGTYFKVGEKTLALLCLPANFIAGKMMLVRAMVLGWNLHVVAPEKDALTQYDNDYDLVAMVPYQVLHSIDALPKVKKLIIGGGPVSMELEEKLQSVPTEVFATYGMTETSTHIAIRRINGPAKSEVFSALPNVKFATDDRNCLVIHAPEILGESIITNDIVELISPSSFRFVGRIDNMINTGGVKLFPEAIEAKLSEFIKLPFIITAEKDPELGERVVLIFENGQDAEIPNYSLAFAALEPFERPKKVYSISKFPYTVTGKIKRADVLQVLQKYR